MVSARNSPVQIDADRRKPQWSMEPLEGFTRRAGSNRWGFNGNTHSGHRLIQVIVFYMITHIRFSGWLFEICVFVHPIWDDD